jgi:hypothetical protein
MVYAFVIHTLLPGPCHVLYHNVYGQDATYTDEEDDAEHKNQRRSDIQLIANEVVSLLEVPLPLCLGQEMCNIEKRMHFFLSAFLTEINCIYYNHSSRKIHSEFLLRCIICGIIKII